MRERRCVKNERERMRETTEDKHVHTHVQWQKRRQGTAPRSKLPRAKVIEEDVEVEPHAKRGDYLRPWRACPTTARQSLLLAATRTDTAHHTRPNAIAARRLCARSRVCFARSLARIRIPCAR